MILTTAKKIQHYNALGFWGTKTFLDQFRENVAANPERIALIDPPNKPDLVGLPAERINYQKLSDNIDSLATALQNLGIKKDDIVMVQLPNIWELSLVYMAITRVGAIFSPMPMQWRASEFEYINGLTEAKLFISVDDFHGFKHLAMAKSLQAKPGHLQHFLNLSAVRKLAFETKADVAALDAISLDANDVFSLCWSSGTESHPKGCPMSHNNWFYQGQIMHTAFGLEQKAETILCCAPMVNMTGVGVGFILWLLSGGTIVFHHPFDGALCIKQIMQEKVSRTILVPAVLNAILKHPDVDQFDLSHVESILTGSAPPSVWALEQFKKRWGIDIACGWGQTEGTAIMVGVDELPDINKRVRYYPNLGDTSREWLIKGVETKIVDPDTKQVLTKVGQVGELAYKGPNVFPGYFKKPEITEKSFDSDDYFYTGDLFKIEEDAYISFFDRSKDIIIRGGNNISAQEIENILQGHPEVMDVAAVAMPDQAMGERTCVYVVPMAAEQKPDLKSLTDFMSEKGIAVYKLPERVEYIAAIPRNPVGKILKPQLRKDIASKLQAGKSS